MANYKNRGSQIVREKLIEPYFKNKDKYIGVEIEYPVISHQGCDIRLISSGLLVYLIENYCFTEQVRSGDDLLVRVISLKGDCVSFDFHYEQIEFSMWRDNSLAEIAKRFYLLLKVVMDYYKKHGCRLVGFGTNFNADFDHVAFVDDDFTRFVKGYMEHHTYYKNANCIFNNMFSTQTHMDVVGERLLDAFNLMNKLDFARGLLFSNSLPNPHTLPVGKYYPEGTLCARDFNWDYSDFPAIGCFNQEFKDIDELAEFIAGLEFFIDKKEGRIVPVDKISISSYFENPKNTDENISLFRMFSHTALNQYFALEIRSDCVQPMSEAFAPSAFHVGILSNLDAAIEETSKFFYDNEIVESNSRLRKMAVTGREIIPAGIMKGFLWRLYDVSLQGLLKRGYGEEAFMECMKERIDTLSCPAKRMREQLAKGVTMEEMMQRYGCFEGERL